MWLLIILSILRFKSLHSHQRFKWRIGFPGKELRESEEIKEFKGIDV